VKLSHDDFEGVPIAEGGLDRCVSACDRGTSRARAASKPILELPRWLVVPTEVVVVLPAPTEAANARASDTNIPTSTTTPSPTMTTTGTVDCSPPVKLVAHSTAPSGVV